MVRRPPLPVLFARALVALALGVLSAGPAARAAGRPPVLVELFTAQGCSSCLKADAVLGDLAEQPEALPLTFSVGYWDYLGWADTFAKPAFEARQRAYTRRMALREVYTPQVVVDGKIQASGAKAEAVKALVATAAAAKLNPPDMQFLGDKKIAVGSARALRGGAELWLVRYMPGQQEVAIKRGDNRGQTAVHTNVVRQIVRLGAWTGRPAVYSLPPAQESGLATVAVLQGAKGGRVLGLLKGPAVEHADPAVKPATSSRHPAPAPGQ